MGQWSYDVWLRKKRNKIKTSLKRFSGKKDKTSRKQLSLSFRFENRKNRVRLLTSLGRPLSLNQESLTNLRFWVVMSASGGTAKSMIYCGGVSSRCCCSVVIGGKRSKVARVHVEVVFWFWWYYERDVVVMMKTGWSEKWEGQNDNVVVVQWWWWFCLSDKHRW